MRVFRFDFIKRKGVSLFFQGCLVILFVAILLATFLENNYASGDNTFQFVEIERKKRDGGEIKTSKGIVLCNDGDNQNFFYVITSPHIFDFNVTDQNENFVYTVRTSENKRDKHEASLVCSSRDNSIAGFAILKAEKKDSIYFFDKKWKLYDPDLLVKKKSLENGQMPKDGKLVTSYNSDTLIAIKSNEDIPNTFRIRRQIGAAIGEEHRGEPIFNEDSTMLLGLVTRIDSDKKEAIAVSATIFKGEVRRLCQFRQVRSSPLYGDAQEEYKYDLFKELQTMYKDRKTKKCDELQRFWEDNKSEINKLSKEQVALNNLATKLRRYIINECYN